MDEDLSVEDSSSDEDSEDDGEVEGVISRTKRETLGDMPNNDSSAGCTCPSSSTGLKPWFTPGDVLDPAGAGNPVYGYRMQLYSRTGYHLMILPNYKIWGSSDDSHKYAYLEFSSVDFGEVQIKGVESQLYLAMDARGRLYGEVNRNDERTVFVEMVIGQYNAYLSKKFAHLGWYVALKKSGKPKPGNKTKWGQKAIQFLPKRKTS